MEVAEGCSQHPFQGWFQVGCYDASTSRQACKALTRKMGLYTTCTACSKGTRMVSRVDSKKFQHGCRMIDAGCPRFFELEHGHVPLSGFY